MPGRRMHTRVIKEASTLEELSEKLLVIIPEILEVEEGSPYSSQKRGLPFIVQASRQYITA